MSRGLIVIAVILLSVSLYLQKNKGSKEAASRTPLRSSDHADQRTVQKIDRQLKAADMRQSNLRQGVEIENQESPEIGELQPPTGTNEKVNQLSFDQENSERVMKQLEGRPSGAKTLVTPDQRISKKLERDQWISDYEKRYNEAYIRQFVDNAKKNGLDVRLNKNLDVTGVGAAPLEDDSLRLPDSEPSK